MDKQQFNDMEVMDQLQYINDNLSNISLTKLCDDIGVNRSTISKRFKSKGYIFNKEENKYTYNNQEVNKQITVSKQTTVNKQEMDILQRIKRLETLVDELVNNKIDKQDLKDFIKFNKEIDVVVSYRLDYTTKERFKNFCNKHSEYKTKDILSSVLNDFLDKYE